MQDKEITISKNQGFMQFSNIEQAMQFAELISKTSFCPKQMVGKTSDIVIALQMGQELGLKPMQALQNIAVINGRPSVWGDAMLAICRQSPDFEYIKEEYLEDSKTAVCRVKRKNEPEFSCSFSEDDAKKANLLGKEGPWRLYPKRMKQMRARGFCLRDSYADLLRGIISIEEARDIVEKVDYSKVGITIDAAVYNNKINSDQLLLIKEKIEQTDVEEKNICDFFKIDQLEALSVGQFEKAITILERKILKKKKLQEETETNDWYYSDDQPEMQGENNV